MNTKNFTIGAVLTVTTGIVLTRDFGEAHALMDHLTGDSLFTHQLPRAADPCKAALLAQFPALASVTPPENARDTWEAWLETEAAILGTSFDVAPMSGWESRNPMTEAEEMFGKGRVGTVKV